MPVVYRLTKTYSGPEDETATGPNFPRQYTVTADVARGSRLTQLQLTDVLPDNVQFVSVDSTLVHGARPRPMRLRLPHFRTGRHTHWPLRQRDRDQRANERR